MRSFITLICIALLSGSVSGADLHYPFFLIPDSLAADANAVLRDAERHLVILSDNRAELHERRAVTILNEKGDMHGIFIAFYDRQRSVSAITIRIYDALGKLMEKVKTDDIRDYSAVSGFSLYEDDRMLVYEPVVRTYPYTVVTEYTISYNGIIQFPPWQPQLTHDLSVQQADFMIRLQKNNDVRWKQRNMIHDPDSSVAGNDLEIRWKVRHLPAFERVAFMPPLEDITPNVVIAPLDFSYAGHKGSFRSWEDFGSWTGSLLRGRDQVSDETRDRIRSLAAGMTDTVEMIRTIYRYVQERTRYVSIQYGIGGFQPFEASVVDEVGYGDCKALTNYTKALLQCAGIRSLYTIVNAGSYADDILADFPGQQFNHVILHVPLAGDTVWLECTNQDMPFGYLGRFTADRTALAITEGGGTLVRTQKLADSTAYTLRRSEFKLDESGNGHAGIELTFAGLDYDDVFPVLQEDSESQKKWLYENICMPDATIGSFAFDNRPGRIPGAVVIIDLVLNKYAARSGKRLFIPLNALSAQESTPPSQEERKLDIHFRYATNELDTMTCFIPEGFEIEHLPEPVEISNRFGSFRAAVEQLDNRIVYTRQLSIRKGVYPAEVYPEVYDFYRSVVKADHGKLVLKMAE